jgi:hypothetical protein
MKYTPQDLLQIYMNGSMTEEAQDAFNRLMSEDPQFSETVTNAMAERMGPVPEESVNQISSRLDAKIESIWVKNQPSKMTQLFKMVFKGTFAVVIAGVVIYSASVLWPKLLALFPQIDLSASNSLSTSAPPAKLAPPVMIAPQGGFSDNAASAKAIPTLAPKVVKVAAAKQGIAPTAVPTAYNPSYGTQVGDSIRLAVDTDKTQAVIVTVLNPSGYLVRHLYQGLWVAGNHFVDWNGKDDLSRSVSPGNYTIVVQAGDKKMSGIVTIK